MALHMRDGDPSARDVRVDRIAFGTIGNELITPLSVSPTETQTYIDDITPGAGITYWKNIATSGGRIINREHQDTFLGYMYNGYDMSGTVTFIPINYGLSARFKGTSVGVVTRENNLSVNLRVYIDGVETPGKTTRWAVLNADVTPTDTSITFSSHTLTDSPGQIILGKEIISYTTLAGNTISGLTRGVAPGVAATSHYVFGDSAYEWSSRPKAWWAATGGRNLAPRQAMTIWYNQYLQPGEHEIMIVVADDFAIGSPTDGVYFDAFTLKGLLGADNILTTTSYINIIGTTDANGFSSLGGFLGVPGNQEGFRAIGQVGIMQTTPDPVGGTAILFKVGVKQSSTGGYQYYICNGPPSSSYNIFILLHYLARRTT